MQMELFTPLNLFGSVVVTLMMVFYAMEGKNTVYTLLFAAMCIGASLYGFLAGTWPFGVIEAVWAIVALRKFLTLGRTRTGTA